MVSSSFGFSLLLSSSPSVHPSRKQNSFLPLFFNISSGLSISLSVRSDQHQDVSIHSLWPSHSTWCLPCCRWHAGGSALRPLHSPHDHMGLFTYLDPGLALQKQSPSGELPASLHGSCSSLVRSLAQLSWPRSSLSSDVCFGAGLVCSASFDPSSKTFP